MLTEGAASEVFITSIRWEQQHEVWMLRVLITADAHIVEATLLTMCTLAAEHEMIMWPALLD